MKLSRIIAAILLICIVLSFAGCDPSDAEYIGKSPELLVTALNSALGIDPCDLFPTDAYPLFKDSQGRIMFLYLWHSSLQDQNDNVPYMCGLFVCQKSDNKYSYYYPDVDFLTFKNLFTANLSDTEKYIFELPSMISDEQLSDFKARNDWDKPIDDSKCTKVKISRFNKTRISDEDREKVQNATKFNNLDVNDFIYVTSDDYERQLYFFRERSGVTYGKSYVTILDPTGAFDSKTAIMEIEDIFNYNDAVRDFKIRNNWNQPLA